MIIKSLFRRYERWNPVHPTYGAFWGIGVGVGCGIGWGPGYGPEVIGYVGAGCGAGFNVGYTLLGVGIGLPANAIYTVPHDAFMVTRRRVLDFVQVQQSQSASFSGFNVENLIENVRNLPDVKSVLVSHAECVTDRLQRFSRSFFPWDRDSKS